ncbi:hypothetical protein GCM10023085_09040 [Actinomadura viridis]
MINGTVGAGKTSTAEAAGDLLAAAGIPHAVMDLDWLRACWPSPPGDRFNAEMQLRNLRSVAANYLAAGFTRLVLAGVLESDDDRRRCADALSIPLDVCRLHVDLPVIHRRLAHRHHDDGPDLQWHLARSGELAAILERTRVEDTVVDGTLSSVSATARAVLKSVSWL